MNTVYVDTDKELTKRKIKKITKKICKMNKKQDIVVALSARLKQNMEMKNILEENDVNVLDGTWLFKFLLSEIVDYISKKSRKKEETQIVAILMKEQDEIIFSQIIDIAIKVKTLQIITSMSYRFKYLEEKLYEEYGIALQITNNKQKTLLNTDIIINFDYTEEEIKEYTINENAVIINIKNKIYNIGKININNYKIKYNKENHKEIANKEEFNDNVIYESYIYRRDTYLNIKSQLKKDSVRIVELS